MDRNLTVLMPAYNEAAYVERILERLLRVELPCGLGMQVVVVDDASTDGTAERVEAFKATHPEADICLLRHSRNSGKGTAIRTALEVARGEFCVVQDADEEYDPEDFKQMCRVMIEENEDVVYGSRYLLEGRRAEGSRLFYNGARWLTRTANLLYGQHLTDEATCYKMFRTRLLRSLNLKCTGFEFCPEVTAKVARRGIRIREVPISYSPRSVQQGKKIGWGDGIEAMLTLLKYRLIH